MEFLGAPWPVITSALRKAKKRVAVTPYLNGDAFGMLPLRERKDILVVDACEQNVKAGVTNPHEIAKFMDVGVQCFTVDDLHAKAYLADKNLFVGSMNASAYSRDTLIEACLQVRSAAVCEQFEVWLAGQALVPMTAERVTQLKVMYRAPRWVRRANHQPQAANAWILWVDRDNESKETEEFVENVADAYDIDSDDIYPITVSKRNPVAISAKKGDEVFVLDHRDGRVEAFAPMRLIEPATRIGSRYRLALKWIDESPVRFGTFLKTIRKVYPGFKDSGKSCRGIKAAAATELRKLWGSR